MISDRPQDNFYLFILHAHLSLKYELRDTAAQLYKEHDSICLYTEDTSASRF